MNPDESGAALKSISQHQPATINWRATMLDLLILTLVWIAAVITVHPVGEFPLNDDWSWAMTTKGLVEGQGYNPTAWTGMTLLTHALWGALFCLPNGFSFTALRISTLVLSLVGVLGLYALIRQLHRPRAFAFIAALALAFNPIFFALSNTFMTDVPFSTLLIVTSIFFVRYLQTGADTNLLFGTTLAVAATLSRQMALCLPFAFCLTLFLKYGFQKRQLVRALIPTTVCLAALFAFQYWLKVSGKTPANPMQTVRLEEVLKHPIRIPLNLGYYGWSMLMYLGWFLLPVALLGAAARHRPKGAAWPGSAARIALGLFLLATGVRFFVLPKLMPVHNNIIIPEGIGPTMLHDTFDLHLPHLPELPKLFWGLITVLSLVGGALLAFNITKRLAELLPKGRLDRTNADAAIAIFFLLAAIIYIAPFAVSGFFDRYLLPVAAFLTAFLAAVAAERGSKIPRTKFVAAILLIAGTGIFAVVGTRDYLEWNRTRWIALEKLLASPEVHTADIDGGFEFNGWYSFDKFSPTTGWSIDGKYVITLGPITGYETVASYGYKHWMPPHDGQILVLKRKAKD